MVCLKKLRCELVWQTTNFNFPKAFAFSKTLFGGVERLLDSSSAMAVVPFSGDDPLEDRGFMPFAKAFAETSRFKDVPRI